jgi:hypothetical protein
MNNCFLNDRHCPVCGSANECRIANGCLYKGPCWCEAASIPPAVQRHFADAGLEPVCLSRMCLAKLARHSERTDSAEAILAHLRAAALPVNPNQSDHFYLDETGRTVFTAAYHLKRGYCCGNGCRHCPYGNGDNCCHALSSD